MVGFEFEIIKTNKIKWKDILKFKTIKVINKLIKDLINLYIFKF